MPSTPTANADIEDQAFFFTIASELFCQLAEDGRVLLANPAFRRQLGDGSGNTTTAPANLIEQACITEDKPRAAAFFTELQHSAMGSTVSLTLRCQTLDERTRWLEWVAQRRQDGSLCLVGRDVSADTAVKALNQTLQERNQDIQEFVFVSSHDLQEPVRKIRAFSERLKLHCGDQLDTKALDYLERMDSAGARMQQLISDLLSYSRVSSRALSPVPVKLDRLIADTLVTLELTISDQAARVEVQDLPEIEGDASQLQQLFQNLISNALKFVPAGTNPSISIASEPADDHNGVQIVVADRGIGIDEKYVHRVFAPFQRLHNRQQYSGTGIGLAIVRKVVTRHGGSIRLEPNPGGGTRAVVRLQRRVPNHDAAYRWIARKNNALPPY